MEKQTAAILLARGPIGKSFKSYAPLGYKALLEIDGRPMVDYVLRALQESEVERVFIVQCSDEGLDEVVTKSDKNVFLSTDTNPSSYFSSLLFGLEKVVEYYSPDELRRRNILIVHCDTPLVKKESFDSLIEGSECIDAHIIMPIIERRYLEEAYPKRHFRSVYLKDLKGRYSPQNAVFLNGALLVPFRNRERYGTKIPDIFGLDEDVVSEWSRTVDRLRRHRERAYQWPHLVFEVSRLLIKRRQLSHVLRLVYNLCRGKLTAEQIGDVLRAISGLKIDYFKSREAEVSGDVDRPEDLEWVSGIRYGRDSDLDRSAAGAAP